MLDLVQKGKISLQLQPWSCDVCQWPTIATILS